MTSHQQGLHGNTGSLNGLELFSSLQTLACTGTLVLETPQGLLLLLLDKGEQKARYPLGVYQGLQQSAQEFHFYPHEPSRIPVLPGRFHSSVIATLRALPLLSNKQAIHTTDLRLLFEHLQTNAFNGCLSYEHDVERGLVLINDGQIAAAFFENDGAMHAGNDALRYLHRRSLDALGSHFDLRALNKTISSSLLGLALLQHRPNPPETFTGLECSERGYTFYQHGQAILQVQTELVGKVGYYLACSSAPELHLPDELPGWEEQRYLLTLRGKDALNPMTDLAMQFQREVGHSGKRLLQQLASGQTIETTARNLKLELAEIKPWLEKLEREGFVRALPRDE